MNDPFAWFWSAMIFVSIAWYALLLFYIGGKGGNEIIRMTRVLSRPAGEKTTGKVEQE